MLGSIKILNSRYNYIILPSTLLDVIFPVTDDEWYLCWTEHRSEMLTTQQRVADWVGRVQSGNKTVDMSSPIITRITWWWWHHPAHISHHIRHCHATNIIWYQLCMSPKEWGKCLMFLTSKIWIPYDGHKICYLKPVTYVNKLCNLIYHTICFKGDNPNSKMLIQYILPKTVCDQVWLVLAVRWAQWTLPGKQNNDKCIRCAAIRQPSWKLQQYHSGWVRQIGCGQLSGIQRGEAWCLPQLTWLRHWIMIALQTTD